MSSSNSFSVTKQKQSSKVTPKTVTAPCVFSDTTLYTSHILKHLHVSCFSLAHLQLPLSLSAVFAAIVLVS